MPRLFLTLALLAPAAAAADWPMGGRDATRNPVSPEKGSPTDWQVKTDEHAPRNVRWSVRLGSRAIGGPVVAGGLVWVGTNNTEPLDPKVQNDRAVLACFRESDGKFVYQHASPRLDDPLDFGDWPTQSQSGSPLVEGDRLWFKNNRAEVVGLDIGPLRKGTGPAREVWKVDLIKDHGVRPSALMIPSPDTPRVAGRVQGLPVLPYRERVPAGRHRRSRPRGPDPRLPPEGHRQAGLEGQLAGQGHPLRPVGEPAGGRGSAGPRR